MYVCLNWSCLRGAACVPWFFSMESISIGMLCHQLHSLLYMRLRRISGIELGLELDVVTGYWFLVGVLSSSLSSLMDFWPEPAA